MTTHTDAVTILRDALQRLKEAVEYTPLGVRGITAIENARKALAATEPATIPGEGYFAGFKFRIDPTLPPDTIEMRGKNRVRMNLNTGVITESSTAPHSVISAQTEYQVLRSGFGQGVRAAAQLVERTDIGGLNHKGLAGRILDLQSTGKPTTPASGSIGDAPEFRRLVRNCEHKSMGLFEHRNAREELVAWLDALWRAAVAPDLILTGITGSSNNTERARALCGHCGTDLGARDAALRDAAQTATIHSQYPVQNDFDRGYSKARKDAAIAIRAMISKEAIPAQAGMLAEPSNPNSADWREAYLNMKAFAESMGLNTTTYGPGKDGGES